MAEEIPRWFGFSLVVIYLAGLGAVGILGMSRVREDAAMRLEKSIRYGFAALSKRIHLEEGTAPSDPGVVRSLTREICDFAAHFPVEFVRVVDHAGRVLASTNTDEVGTVVVSAPAAPAGAWITGFESAQQSERLASILDFRTPVFRHGATTDPSGPAGPEDAAGRPGHTAAGGSDDAGQYYLEVSLFARPTAASGLVEQADALMVVLVVMGALFVLYRCLRAQFRGVSRIADRLWANRERIEQDLSSLRLADTSDALTTAWNELVDQAQCWLEDAQRREANEELKGVLERSAGGALATALNALPDGLMYVSEEVRFEYMNSAAHRMLGWSAEDAKGMNLTNAQADGIGGGILEVVRGALSAGGMYESRMVVLGPEGPAQDSAGSYRVWVVPLRQGRRHGECLVVVRDVSQQVRAERAREEFVTQVTHELRTPLTNIRAYAETLSSGMFDDPTVITECYNVITKETRRLSRLIEDILSVSQLEVGSIELRSEDVDLKTLLSESVRDVRGLADEKNIDMQLVLPSKLEPIRTDRDKLAVVVNNLLGNAIKYTPAGGNVIVGCQTSADQAVITFKDNGIGVDPAEHAQIFEKFHRSNDPDVRNEVGTGVGLYTAREIVRRQGGDIEVISKKGEGSTFVVRLPHQGTRAGALSASSEASHHG